LTSFHDWIPVTDGASTHSFFQIMNRFSGDVGTILVVDDEQANIQVVGTMLSAFGYDLMIAKDGEQALERVKAKIPDLVLLDVMMPGLSGFEVCRIMRGHPEMKDVPIIFLSADDDKNTIVKALECGGVDYVTKPFNKAELLSRVRSHLELKSIRDQCRGLLYKTERFLEIMAHDLRNWVGSANFSALLLSEIEELPEKGKKISAGIVDSTSQALKFIDEYLSNARESNTSLDLQKRVLDLPRIVKQSIRMHSEEAAQKSITLHFEAPEAEVKVKSDATALARILENLITNAIKFSAPGGKVQILLNESVPSVTVADSGPGFSQDDRERLFQPYTRLSARPTGGEISTGLGLSIVKQLCDQLGVEIQVGDPEVGAEITLQFVEE